MQIYTFVKLLCSWYYYLPVCLLGVLSHCNGQSNVVEGTVPVKALLTLSGEIKTATGDTVAAGLVALLRPDSSLVKATFSDSTGHFAFHNLLTGPYKVHFEGVGLVAATRPVVLLDSVTNVILITGPKPINLTEVQVKEKKPIFEVLGDRIVLNIESNPINAGGYAIDALSLAPRVTVDPIAKSVSIDGKSGLILYQNGRQLYLPASEVVTYLQSLPANSISRIEIITNPPAQYDAGSSGVILIYTKGLNLSGFNGELNLTVGVGRYLKSNASLSLSLRTAKVQGTFLYTPSYRPTYFSWRSEQQLSGLSVNQQGYSRSQEFNKIDNASHLFRTSWDWKPAKTITIGTILQASTTGEIDTPSSSIDYQLTNPNARLTQIDAVTQLKAQITNAAANLNLNKQFSKPQTSLSVDIDWTRYSNNSLSSATFTQNLPEYRPAESVQIAYPNLVQIRTAKVDFSTSFAKKGQFESGLKYSAISMSNQPTTERYTAAFAQLEPLLSRSYQYKERTTSGYVNLNYNWSSWSLQTGLRLEHTAYQGQSGAVTTVNRDYINLFPSVNLLYTTADKHQYNISANRRIIRPGFDLLNPAYIFYDPLTLYSGNPLLLPQLTTTLQLNYSTPKRTSLTLIYSDSRNRIAEIVYRIDSTEATTLNYKINFDWEKRIAATLSIPVNVTPGWQLMGTVTGARSQFYSTFKDTPITTSQSTAIFRLNNTFKGKVWSANVNITYRGKAVVGYMLYDPIWYVDLGLQRPLGARAALKLAASDIFHTVLITNYGDYLNTKIIFRHKYESQRVLLTYSYRFGNVKAKSIKQRQFGSDTEQGRLGGDARN